MNDRIPEPRPQSGPRRDREPSSDGSFSSSSSSPTPSPSPPSDPSSPSDPSGSASHAETGGQCGKRDEYELDALREIGNIAAAHASTALSKLVGENIFIDVSKSHIFPVEKIPRQFQDPHEKFAAVYMDISGSENNSIILLIIPFRKAQWLSAKLLDKELVPESASDDEEDGLAEDDREAITEIGNICICAYLNAISSFIGETLLPSPPGVAVDMLGAILQFPAVLAGRWSETAIVIETKFIHEQDIFKGTTLFLPDQRSKERVFSQFKLNQLCMEE